MPQLNLKSSHQVIKNYFASLQQFHQHDITHEGAVSNPFAFLLDTCAKKVNATFVPQYRMRSPEGNNIVLDGAVIDQFKLPFAYWEAKDMDDDLSIAVQEKRNAGYPFDNILFQTPEHAILFQNDVKVLDVDITDPTRLITALDHLFAAPSAALENWHAAVAEFKEKVPALGRKLAELITEQHETNPQFATAFTTFYEQCRDAINPNLSKAAVEEMLIQHLLTERIFRTVFDNPDFTRRNIIAREIENVIDALIRQAFSRDEFLEPLNPFYTAIENAASLCKDFSQKQGFLNTVYEQFFQGFSVEVADTHGIVYTPQPIVDFMVNSVEHILKTEFNRLLSDTGVHIIDPFVGTGNFIVRLMQDIQGATLEVKYRNELHCNEILLLPYYIACLNIEHEYFQRTHSYLPFEGIALADTFELLEDRQLGLFSQENTDRVEKQKEADMFVVIGNPPYNARQVNDSDNNRNRKYETIDKRIKDTYAADSAAQLKNKLYDPYIKAFSWASKRIGEEGVVAFVSNNGFLDGIAFDGMRKHLAQDFDAIYILDLGGNLRKGLKVADANVFGIRVGVSINLFVKTKLNPSETARIFYYRTDDLWNKDKKFDFMNEHQNIDNIEWQIIQPNKQYTWLTEGLHAEFDTFISMGSKEAKSTKVESINVIFNTYSLGICTNRDAWVRNFYSTVLAKNIQLMINTYNAETDRWERRENRNADVNNVVLYDDTKIKWSSTLKRHLKSGHTAEFAESKIRQSLSRPFTKTDFFFDKILTDRPGLFPLIFPTTATEKENRVICVAGIGDRKGFGCLATNIISTLDLAFENTQCFPFYTYNEDGTNRKENITDWALAEFRKHYGDDTISKWDIFHYNYGLLHHPTYREKYQANLKRDLPHVPFADDFWGFSRRGVALSDLHVNYESQPKYDGLTYIETPGVTIDWRVEKMKLSKDKKQLVYNDFLTIDGIPPKVFEYKLGTRSALEWVIDQYRVKTDKRSGIVNDPNRADEPRYIVNLIARVIYVSLKTVEMVDGLPGL